MPAKKENGDNAVKNGEPSFQVLLEENRRNSYRIEVLEQAIPNLAYRIHCLENPEQIPYREIPRQQFIEPEIQQPIYHQKVTPSQPWEGEIKEEPKKEEIKKPRKKLLLIGAGIIVGLWLLYIINGLMHGQQIILPF